MTVTGASRPGGMPPGQDRWAATERGVIVLDGATAYDPAAPPADAYVDALLASLTDALDGSAPLPTILAGAIDSAASQLRLKAGAAPSSTVLLLRETGGRMEALVLGDSTMMLGFRDGRRERLTDSRMSDVATELRARYRDRLRAGHGYDPTHAELLGRIQQAERAVRNADGGYWIAEACPRAGHHALTRSYPVRDVTWAVLATDGAQRGLDRQRVAWSALPAESADRLRRRLDDLQRWETDTDPDATQLPRAKPHDDKTLVTWTNDHMT